MSECFPIHAELDAFTQLAFGGFLQDKIAGLAQDPTGVYVFVSLDPARTTLPLCDITLSAVRTGEHWSETDLWLCVEPLVAQRFWSEFNRYLTADGFSYDNLLHLTMIVKNGGATLERVLESYLPAIDRWTILDTGSTDGTQEVIRRTLAGKRGHLYEEPFQDFSTSRNRCLDLAGNASRFLIMADDTYELEGDLRAFLDSVRSDQFCQSFTITVWSEDLQYISNRVLKTHQHLRFQYKVHEVVEMNTNVLIPFSVARLHDIQTAEMAARTTERFQRDMQWLKESVDAEPDNPRHLYYLARTLACLGQFKQAYEWFLRRATHVEEGFSMEKIDAWFEAAQIADTQLHKPWGEVDVLYEKAYQLDAERPEVPFMRGAHYYHAQDYERAYKWLKEAFELGFPAEKQFMVRRAISFARVPILLTDVCFYQRDWALGRAAATYFLEHNSVAPERKMMACWQRIFDAMLRLPAPRAERYRHFPICCVVGERKTIQPIVEQLSEHTPYQLFGFVMDLDEKRGSLRVDYWFRFIQTHVVDLCVLVDVPEYLLATYESCIDQVWLMSSETPPILPDAPKLTCIWTTTDEADQALRREFSELAAKIRRFTSSPSMSDFAIASNSYMNSAQNSAS